MENQGFEVVAMSANWDSQREQVLCWAQQEADANRLADELQADFSPWAAVVVRARPETN